MTSPNPTSAQVPLPPTLSALFPKYRERAVRYAYWLLNNQCDSEEVVQEAFCRIAQREQNGKPIVCEQSFAGLLFTAVRNLSIDRHRKFVRRRTVSLSHDHEPEARHNDNLSASQLQEELSKQMGALPENWAEALKLKVMAELTYDEIANVLGCTKAQVRTWIHRARKQLAEQLKKGGWLEDR